MAKATTASAAETKKATPTPKQGGKLANKGGQAKPNIFQRFVSYIKDVRTEMRRVVWPTRQEVINSSVVVIVTLLFFVVFTFVVDQAAVWILQLLRQIGG